MFSAATPRLWNSLPDNIRLNSFIDDLKKFKNLSFQISFLISIFVYFKIYKYFNFMF